MISEFATYHVFYMSKGDYHRIPVYKMVVLRFVNREDLTSFEKHRNTIFRSDSDEPMRNL